MLGYRDANSETLKWKVLAHYKLCCYALRADFQFGFCKNTQKLENINAPTYILTSTGSISTKFKDSVSLNSLSLMEITKMLGLLFHHLCSNQELMVAITACKRKKKGLILASLTMKPNLKQLQKCPSTGDRVYMRYQ